MGFQWRGAVVLRPLLRDDRRAARAGLAAAGLPGGPLDRPQTSRRGRHAACGIAAGIPARLGFADVKNHLATPRLTDLNGGDVFHWHAYTDLHLEGRWVKATPAFDLALCERFGVLPLEFDASGSA